MFLPGQGIERGSLENGWHLNGLVKHMKGSAAAALTPNSGTCPVPDSRIQSAR
jgi:hypothetical protein